MIIVRPILPTSAPYFPILVVQFVFQSGNNNTAVTNLCLNIEKHLNQQPKFYLKEAVRCCLIL